MKNEVEIKVDKAITGLAGYDYGKKIYTEQVKGKINFSEDFTFIFPNNVQRIASSFIQGFFEDIMAQIGVAGVERQLNVISANNNLKRVIIENLV